ncbi:MAG: chemotaxis protein CheB, partial [Cyanobacteria bacterium J06639_14]
MGTSQVAFIVGIGASAGGLRALEEFFQNMPSDSQAAFVVIQHLSPNYVSLMVELLDRHTNMAVQRVTDQMPLAPNTIFLIPPGQNLVIVEECLHLIPQDRDEGRQPHFPIDLFFESLAKARKDHAIGIVLSGTGSDGSRGIQDLAEQGGIVLVQHPETAEFDGMPQSAIATGMVDLILSPSEIAQVTSQFVTSPADLKTFRQGQADHMASTQLQRIIDLIEQHEDLDFTNYKPSSIGRRVQRRCMIAGYKNLEDYIQRLEDSAEERRVLRNDLLITVTRFFRDTEAWQLLEQQVIPELIEQAEPVQPPTTLRLWITACATGEEAYSMAMVLREQLDQRQSSLKVKIFATDIDQLALQQASTGVYPAASLSHVSEARRERFFVQRDNDTFEVTRTLREMLIFASHNLAKDAAFTHMHLVSCRNVLIYMQPDLQSKVLRHLHFALKPKGILFLGESETLNSLESEFNPLFRKWKIYQKVRDVKLSLPIQDIPKLTLKPALREPFLTKSVPRFDPLLANAFKALLANHYSTCLLVDRQNQLMYVCGDALKLIQVPDGRISQDILTLLPQSFRVPLSTALHRVRQDTEHRVHYGGCRLSRPGSDDMVVSLEVNHQVATQDTTEFFMVVIARDDAPKTEMVNPREVSGETAQYVLQLEQELQSSRESLQATVEELETTNEEQQATNEELIGSNEELQSTNEELQSVNEELYTVNAEYQGKIQQLMELTNDLDNLLKNIDVGVIFLDTDLRIRKFTPAATQACNLVEADVDRPIHHITHNLENCDLLAVLEQFQQQGDPMQLEVKVKHQGPYLLMQVHPYLQDSKIVEGLLVTFVDINGIKQTQLQLEAAEARLKQTNESLETEVQKRTAELEASERFLQGINQSTPNSIYIYDLVENRNVYANRSLATMLGYTPEALQVMGPDLTTHLFHPEDSAKITAYHQSIMASVVDSIDVATDHAADNYLDCRMDAVFSVEYRVRSAAGDWRWLYSQDVVFKCSLEGTPTQILGTAIDITDRKVAEAQLQASESRYRQLYTDTPVIAHSVNPKGEIVEVSNYWLQTFGYERHEVMGRPAIAFLTPESRQYAQEVVLPEYFKTGTCQDVPYQMVGKDGSIREVLLSATSDRDAAGNLVRSLAVMIDVTERNQAEAELIRHREHLEELVASRAAEIQATNQQLQAEILERQHAQQELAQRAQALEYSNTHLEQSNTDLEQFAYVISHDLQEPLRAMTVFSQILAQQYQPQLDATAQTYLNHIVEGGMRMQALIDGILAISRVTNQGQAVEPVDFQTVLATTLENLQTSLTEADATVTYDALPTLAVDENQML